MSLPNVTISRELGITYPTSGDFGPPEAYPEYPFDASRPGALSPANQVYALVRRTLREMGGDAENFGTPAWNPLKAWIQPGQRVFLLVNFVKHGLPGEPEETTLSKCTHGSVIRAMLDYATIATGDPALVSFGNAPIQACEHDTLTEQMGADRVRAFYADNGNPDVGPHDLRLVVSKFAYGAMTEKRLMNVEDGLRVDLGQDSLLETHYSDRGSVDYRIGDYPAEETMSYHGAGRHVYVLNKRVLAADTIISVPKLKTHVRVGITCALKGTVGAIGFKECLAHHRLGGPAQGGDEYPTNTPLRDFASKVCERADGGGTDVASNALRVATKVLNRALRMGQEGIMLGMWHGNDTCWRMSLDIARLLRFCDARGNLHSEPVRHHIGIVDGIIGGEGEGPLRSTPHPTGALLFSSDVALLDAACAYVMGYDPARIPLLAGAFHLDRLPLTEASLDDLAVQLDGLPLRASDLPLRFYPAFVAPKGWRGHVEVRGPHGPDLPRAVR